MNLPAPDPKSATDDRRDRTMMPIELHELLGPAGAIDGMSVEWIFDHFQGRREPQ